MAAVPLKIVLHGLIALVPIVTPDGTDHMTALILNPDPMPGMECAFEHAATVSFVVRDSSADTCLKLGCRTPQGNLCVCEKKALAGKDLSLKVGPDPALVKARFPVAPVRELPSDVTEAASFAYVANLEQAPFNLRLDPRYLSDSPLSPLLARITFPFSQVTSCALVKRFDKDLASIHSMTFGFLANEGKAEDMSQAMAQQVVADLMVPPATTTTPQSVSLLVRAFGQTKETPLELEAGQDGYLIEITNDTTPELEPDSPCDDGVARHFAHYYQLALNPPEAGKELIPHVRPTQWVSPLGLTPPACVIPTFDPNDRPVCPVGSFYRP